MSMEDIPPVGTVFLDVSRRMDFLDPLKGHTEEFIRTTNKQNEHAVEEAIEVAKGVARVTGCTVLVGWGRHVKAVVYEDGFSAEEERDADPDQSAEYPVRVVRLEHRPFYA